MIGIYNNGSVRINGTFIQNIMPCAEPQPIVYGEISELGNCNIAIAHVSDEEWACLIKHAPRNGVRIRVTTGGNFSDKPPPTTESGVYTFHLVMRAGDLSSEEWQRILSDLSNEKIVQKLVVGENPDGLRCFFAHEVQEHLSALTILCEGYLAVHADDTNYHTNINPALELMKWTEFRNSESGQRLIQQNLNEKMKIVQQPTWWLNVFKRESLCEDVNKEWGAAGKEDVPKALKHLLEVILGNKSVEPSKVADAYCVLRKKKL